MLTEAPFRVRVEAMMTWTPGFASRSFGSAVSPSITGISMSSTMTSISARFTASIAAWPLPTVETTLISGSDSSVLVSRPRMTAESSTTITRYGPPPAATAGLVSGRIPWYRAFYLLTLKKPDLAELRLDDLAVEGLHDVFVGAGTDRFLNVLDVVLGG